MKNRRKRAVLYLRHVLTNPANLEAKLRIEARRNRLVVEEVIVEADLKQPRLRKLLKSSRSRVIVTPSMFHFAAPDQLVRLVLEAHHHAVAVIFERERLRLRKRTPKREPSSNCSSKWRKLASTQDQSASAKA